MQTIPPQPAPLSTDAVVVREAIARARTGLVDREVVAEVVALCAVAGEHVLVIGAPGTAKSEAVRRTADQLGGRYFEYLLGRFTEPSEIFGPVDLRRLREGFVEFETAGMLPEAEVVFLDEVFLGSTAVLNTLLGILNERVFRRGSTLVTCPLRVCVGAANTLPDDPALAAFADRFLARVFVTPVPDARLDELLEVGWRAGSRPSERAGSLLPALDRLSRAADACDLQGVRDLLASAIRQLRQADVPLSDRRVVRSQRLVAAAAAMDGRTTATADDLWVLPLIAPTPHAQASAREVLSDLVTRGRNASLVYAAEEFARGQQARAARLVDAGSRLLDEVGTGPLTHDDRLRLEATLREIDAGFVLADAPRALQDTRGLLVAAIQR
ncbi:AAA family ATPase [Micromonospora sp. NPDC049171]|uniref:AAA family ATPase n=1 Tax=Micromonospora sp. NPDC049171 TaxID=3155770 RepID=UPI0033FF5D40